MARSRCAAALVLAALPLIARAQDPVAADPFPTPESLREGVDFWKSVWSEWTMAQVVLHDMDHPSIVYEIFELPGPAGDVYSEEQRAYVKGRREALEARLAAIEAKLGAATDLEDDEKAMVLRITERAGGNGIVGASTRVRSQRGLRERFRRGLEISGRYHETFVSIFREAGLPEDLAYLPHVESSFQVDARSSAGAVGVWQFTRGAARKFMLMTPAFDARRDPVAAARGAASYLKAAYDELGAWPLAITSYNHGIGGMRAARDAFGTDFARILAEYDGRAFGFASKNFYKEFLAAREIARNPAAYFPEGLVPEPPLAYDRVVLDRPTAARTVALRYSLAVERLAGLNPAWTHRAVQGKAPIPAGVAVWLPEGTLTRKAAVARPAPAPRPTAPGKGPEGDAAVHVVRRGDTLARIASAYGVSLATLLTENGLVAHTLIHPGQRLRIP